MHFKIQFAPSVAEFMSQPGAIFELVRRFIDPRQTPEKI